MPVEEGGRGRGSRVLDRYFNHAYAYIHTNVRAGNCKSAYHWQLNPRERFANRRGSLSEVLQAFAKVCVCETVRTTCKLSKFVTTKSYYICFYMNGNFRRANFLYRESSYVINVGRKVVGCTVSSS